MFARNLDKIALAYEAHYGDVVARIKIKLYADGYDVSHAQDIAQAVFVDAIAKADKLAEHENIFAWLLKAANYATLNAERALRKQGAISQLSDLVPGQDRASDPMFLLLELNSVAFSVLKPTDYQTYQQYYINGISIDDLCATGISKIAMNVRLSRIKKKVLSAYRAGGTWAEGGDCHAKR